MKDPGARNEAGGPAVVRGWPAWAAGVLVLLVAVLSVLHTAVAPEPRPGDAPAAEFSATRAYAELTRIAQRPHPAGSAANEQVRDRLVARLTELGLRPQVQRSSAGVTGADSSHVFGWAQNVHATLPGTADAGRVLLVAHYDSVEAGPGASDDGVGVATLLEVARAVTSMPSPHAEITFLFTDSEEFGLLGARAFVAAGLAGDPTRDVVLNLDTRGTTGRTIMFETGAHSSALMPAVRAGSPLVTSVSREVYRLLPNETDFTVFRDALYTGLNFAMVDGSARYHSEQDDLSHVDTASLQDMGRAVLGATMTLATASPGLADAGESVYFSVFGLVVDYSAGAVLPLGALALLGSAAALWFARRRGRLRLRSAARVAATAPLVPVGGAAIGWLGWRAMVLAGPHDERFLGGDPYAVVFARTGLALLVVALAALWLVWVSRRGRPAEIAAGGVLITAVLAVVTSILLPGAAYLFTWPALAGAIGLAVVARLPEDSPWSAAVAWLAGVPTVLLTAPLVWLLFGTVGLALASAPLLLLGLAAVTVLPARRTPRRTGAVLAAVAVVAVVAVGLVVVDTVTNVPGARDPAQVSLVYALDADRREAVWASEGDGSGDWVRGYAPTDDPGLEERFPALLSTSEGTRSGPAPVVPVPEATMTVAGETTEGDLRHVRLRISATARPDQLALYADVGGARVERVDLGGTTFPGGENRPSTDTPWHWGVVFSAPPPEGFDLTLTVRGSAPARLLLIAQGSDFPLSALNGPRPDTIRWGGYASGLTFAARSYQV
ncbi:M20/M25/M40 family metallo-hydrolase [Umezawaea sp. Da 62-37]|uniref:M20/M25/M40 family metallo-hydrolase n=1 Tax=Umezawaea sp. Da 62-37 TaxID=3075927 RepID=UPI0028F6C527|nr:M20/M25/M40 family metallo-hydrolase [Umezawaea sp. Da 62-37]WNV92109.1 M28 family peptidase [Umezawaea sp. Da 62-37]